MSGAYDLNGFGRGDQLQQRIAALEAERDQLREELASIIDEALLDGGFPESTPNAAGAMVSSEPTALDVVEWAIKTLRAEVERLTGALREISGKMGRACDDSRNLYEAVKIAKAALAPSDGQQREQRGAGDE